jgi:acyl-coenzyme A thioesterase PaaI-like protein
MSTTQQLDWMAMTATTAINPVLAQWRKLSRSSLGRWLFSRIVCLRAPYFATIRPRFHELEIGRSRISMRKVRAVENHIHSVHAIAMANLCEVAAGLVTEVSIPTTRRWIPRGMTIEYLKRSDTDVTAVARLDKHEWNGPETVAVPVSVTDTAGTEVVRAVISMYVSPRPEKARA